jgi:hypothetical protein
MEWIFWAAVVPRAIEIDVGAMFSVIGGLVTLVPVTLVARTVLSLRPATSRRLQVFNGGRELSRNPA